jgi:peptide/nickel transport system permease protein
VLGLLIRRLLLLIPILLGLTVLLFVIARLLPGDPVALAAGPQATPAQIDALRAEFGLDQPIWIQYFNYLIGLLQGDFGRSVMSRRPVVDDLMTFLPATVELVIAGLFIAVIVGVPLGLLAAVNKNRPLDYLARFTSLFALSTPQFFIGLILQIVLGMMLNLLPLGGRFSFIAMPPPAVTGFMTVDSLIALDFGSFWSALVYLFLPALTLSLSPMATLIGMMRSSAIEVMQLDYVRTARAFGLPPAKIIFKHVFRNAFTATLTVIGLYFGWMLGGTVVVETVFDWPGIGLYATKAIVAQDFMPVIGVALVVGAMFVVTNILVDMLYRLLNPRAGNS